MGTLLPVIFCAVCTFIAAAAWAGGVKNHRVGVPPDAAAPVDETTNKRPAAEEGSDTAAKTDKQETPAVKSTGSRQDGDWRPSAKTAPRAGGRPASGSKSGTGRRDESITIFAKGKWQSGPRKGQTAGRPASSESAKPQEPEKGAKNASAKENQPGQEKTGEAKKELQKEAVKEVEKKAVSEKEAVKETEKKAVSEKAAVKETEKITETESDKTGESPQPKEKTMLNRKMQIKDLIRYPEFADLMDKYMPGYRDRSVFKEAYTSRLETFLAVSGAIPFDKIKAFYQELEGPDYEPVDANQYRAGASGSSRGNATDKPTVTVSGYHPRKSYLEDVKSDGPGAVTVQGSPSGYHPRKSYLEDVKSDGSGVVTVQGSPSGASAPKASAPAAPSKPTITDVRGLKSAGYNSFAAVTAASYFQAKYAAEAGAAVINVNDVEVSRLLLGREPGFDYSTTLDEIIMATQAVKRGSGSCLVIPSIPFGYYNSPEEAVSAATRIMKETGADGLHMEGAPVDCVRAVCEAGWPVLAHAGLNKYHFVSTGSYKSIGRDTKSAQEILDYCREVERAGAFCVVLEGIPTPLGKLITDSLSICTCGIGAGKYCNGQFLVTEDLMGYMPDFKPKFVKKYADISSYYINGIKAFVNEVTNGTFPEQENSYNVKDDSYLNSVR